MKNLKKIASLALALIMALAMMAPALAVEGEETTNVTITEPTTPEGGVQPESITYTAYKILDAEPLGEKIDNNDGETKFDNVAYSINKESPFHNAIKNYEVDGKKVFSLYAKNASITFTN